MRAGRVVSGRGLQPWTEDVVGGERRRLDWEGKEREEKRWEEKGREGKRREEKGREGKRKEEKRREGRKDSPCNDPKDSSSSQQTYPSE